MYILVRIRETHHACVIEKTPKKGTCVQRDRLFQWAEDLKQRQKHIGPSQKGRLECSMRVACLLSSC